MTILLPVAGTTATPLPLAPSSAILAAAELLLPDLERGQRVDATALRRAMETAFGASDASGAWDWKLAYEACEVASVVFLRKYGKVVNGGAKPGQCGGVKPGHCERAGFSPGQAPIGAWPGLRVFVLGIMRGGSHRFPG